MMHAVARRFPAVFPPLLGLVWLASTLAIQADTTDGAWQAAKVDFLRLSRQEHNARIAEWREVAAWTFDDNRLPDGFAVLKGQWKVEEGRLRAVGGAPMDNRLIKLANCVWPAFRMEFDARLDSEDPAHADKICDIILGLNCAPDTGSFAKGYALLAAHYYNQATTLYRLNIPCARVEWSPVEPGRVAHYRTRDYPLQLTHRGVYGFARNLMGDENLAYAFYDEPGLVHDIMETYTNLALRVWEKQVADVDFDLIECWEDMASKNGSIISPDTFRAFMAPCYGRVAAFAREHGIEVILVDSDGYIEELAGLMREAGVTALYPFEVQAGNDVGRVRDRYPSVGIIGGLRKEAMYEGRAAIDREMERARAWIRRGRYIPGPDHFVLNLASFDNYRYFMERMKDVVLTTPVEV